MAGGPVPAGYGPRKPRLDDSAAHVATTKVPGRIRAGCPARSDRPRATGSARQGFVATKRMSRRRSVWLGSSTFPAGKWQAFNMKARMSAF